MKKRGKAFIFGFTYLVFFVVWQGIYDPGQTQQKDGSRGFILLPPQPAVLPRSDAGCDRAQPASFFVIQNCQTHYSSGCLMLIWDILKYCGLQFVH